MIDLPVPNVERQHRATQLGRARRRIFLLSNALDLALLFLLWGTGLSAALWLGLMDALAAPWPALAGYVLVLALLALATGLPIAWYRGHVLPHRYELSHQSLRGWLWDWIRGGGLILLYSLLMAGAFYLAVWEVGTMWWLAFWAVLALFWIGVVYGTPVLLVPLFFKLRPVEDPSLVERIQRLVRRAGTRVAQVCTIDLSSRTVAGNAAVMGLGRSRRVVLGDTLLERFSLDEVETILAHELGHHVHRDLWRGLAVQLGILFVGLLLADQLVRPLLGPEGIGNPADLPLLAAIAQAYGLATAPLANAWSRHQERAADSYAISLTGNPQAFLAAMLRLEEQNLVERKPPRWAQWLFGTHPTMAERLAAAVQAAEGGAS